jgi:hypothetical protein
VLTAGDFLDPASRRIAEAALPVVADGAAFTMQEILARLGDGEAARVAAELYFDGQRRCEEDETAAAAHLATAVDALLSCVQRQRYDEHLLSTVAGVGSGQDDDHRDVIEWINRRRQQGDRPAAIRQDVRS